LEMSRLHKVLNTIVWVIIGILGIYILGYGMKGQSFAKAAYACMKALTGSENGLRRAAEKSLYPGLAYMAGDREPSYTLEELLIRKAAGIFPLYSYLDEKEVYETEIESQAAYDRLVEGGAHDENEINEQTGEAFDIAEKMEEENLQAAHEQEQAALQEQEQSGRILGTEYTAEQLADFDFLRNSFYIVENNTDISAEVLNAENLLNRDMRIGQDNSNPQILIYHTHSQEGFVDSVAGDNSTTIVGVGEYLTELLRDEYGYNVIHNTNVYDFIDGELDRNQAYALAEQEVQQILAENPSIEVIIDLHRDGVKEGTHLVTEVNGKPTAQFMFFNGLSYSKRNGVIDYLPNPYIEDNLALSLQLKLASEKYYPGISRKIYLKSLRYNLHLRPKSLLVEAGAQTNTLEEMMNAMEPLAFVLHEVLGGGEIIEE
jgi:stage II sporulation protein P